LRTPLWSLQRPLLLRLQFLHPARHKFRRNDQLWKYTLSLGE